MYLACFCENDSNTNVAKLDSKDLFISFEHPVYWSYFILGLDNYFQLNIVKRWLLAYFYKITYLNLVSCRGQHKYNKLNSYNCLLIYAVGNIDLVCLPCTYVTLEVSPSRKSAGDRAFSIAIVHCSNCLDHTIKVLPTSRASDHCSKLASILTNIFIVVFLFHFLFVCLFVFSLHVCITYWFVHHHFVISEKRHHIKCCITIINWATSAEICGKYTTTQWWDFFFFGGWRVGGEGKQLSSRKPILNNASLWKSVIRIPYLALVYNYTF